MDKTTMIEGLDLLLGELPWLDGIRDDTTYQDALATLGELSVDDTTPGLLLKMMANCIAEYEASRIPDLLSGPNGSISHGTDALLTLMRHRKIKGKDLAEILELSPALMSSILNGKRALTIPHICKLADFFGVSRTVFI
ncbi:helix-turn-helix domain-containing protein [Salmonella enterica]|nr:helix-turn-helix domain-containing protein [Salmonella enterica]ECH1725987.1 helix-turn-helix domain-containing protein [Salmonella enterica]